VFADYEPHYQTGFRSGTDTRYAGRTFEEIEPELRREHEARGGDSLWDDIRDRVRAGFDRAGR
jgi:hypothetical protein